MSTLAAPASRSLRAGPRWMATIACLLLLGLCAAGMRSGGPGTPAGRFDRGGAAARAALPRGRRDASAWWKETTRPRCSSRKPSSVGPRPRAEPPRLPRLSGWFFADSPGGRDRRTDVSFSDGRHAIQGEASQWVRPLELAVVAAPGLDFASAELGRRYLVRWGALTPEQRRARAGKPAPRLSKRVLPAGGLVDRPSRPSVRRPPWGLCPTTRRRCGWRNSCPGRPETGRRPT